MVKRIGLIAFLLVTGAFFACDDDDGGGDVDTFDGPITLSRTETERSYFGAENGRVTRASVRCDSYEGEMISCNCDTSHTAIHLTTAGIREGDTCTCGGEWTAEAFDTDAMWISAMALCMRSED